MNNLFGPLAGVQIVWPRTLLVERQLALVPCTMPTYTEVL